MRLLVTGGTGFVGTALIEGLLENTGYEINVAIRDRIDRKSSRLHEYRVGNVSAGTNWSAALSDVDCIIHLAACTQVESRDFDESLKIFRQVNLDGTIALAEQALSMGVRRLIFLSTVKVFGESSDDKPFSSLTPTRPSEPYGISKFETEMKIREILKDSNTEFVIIRSPIVYGAGVGANFLQMINWVNLGAPLPFSLVRNKRSLIALDNLVDLIITCINHPRAANEIILVSDGEDLSTPDLLVRVGVALDRPAKLFPVPTGLLSFIATIIGKRQLAQRLIGSMQVDLSRTKELLQWEPPVSFEEGLHKTVNAYKKSALK